VTVGFDNAGHHTGDVTGLGAIERGFGDGSGDVGDRIFGIIIDNSLLHGLAVSRSVLGRNSAWAGLSRSFGLVSAGGYWGGGRRTSIAVSVVVGVIARGVIFVGIIVIGDSHQGFGSGSLTGKLGNSRARELVGSVREGVDANTSVVILVGTREFDEFVGAGGSGLVTANIDLDARGVELSTSGLISQVKGDDLVTKEVPAASEVGRKVERMSLSVELVLLNPSTIALADFVDLEPLSLGSVELVT
jgi:hypothetical protein